VIKRISLLVTAALMAAMMLVATAAPALAAPRPCEPGDPGCKVQDDPDKNNEKFVETSRAQFGSGGENTQDCKVNPNGVTRCR
jgi:hypothetical protein